VFISHIIQLTPHQQSAEPKNSAGAEALAVARRPKELRNKIKKWSVVALLLIYFSLSFRALAF